MALKPAPIVFLDFDGVTHPEMCQPKELFSCLPLIEAVLRRHVQADVVISSTWRQNHRLSELRKFFASDIRKRVVGCTPVMLEGDPRRTNGAVREAECLAWLAGHRPGSPWVAIDDVPWNFSVGCPHLVLTHHPVGFTPADAEHLQNILQRLSS